jgi:hypothetical protein
MRVPGPADLDRSDQTGGHVGGGNRAQVGGRDGPEQGHDSQADALPGADRLIQGLAVARQH